MFASSISPMHIYLNHHINRNKLYITYQTLIDEVRVSNPLSIAPGGQHYAMYLVLYFLLPTENTGIPGYIYTLIPKFPLNNLGKLSPKFAMQRKVECNEMSRTLSKSIVLTVSGGPMEESRRKTPSFVHVALSFCLRDSTGVSGHHYCSPRQQCPQFSEFLTFVSFLYVLLSSFEARQNGIKSWLLSAIIIWRPISIFYTQKNKTK